LHIFSSKCQPSIFSSCPDELYLYRFPKPESEPFRVTIGMAISKSFGGKKHAGKVVEEIEELVIKDGKLVKVWSVEYTDEDTEDLERRKCSAHCFWRALYYVAVLIP
jgi:hypothetical protein